MTRLLLFLLLALSAASCARDQSIKVVTEAGPASAGQQAARSTGRAAGAGGSHAPGGTGLGAGTFGADQAAESGSGR
jgi:hypothetical protein